MLNPPNTSERYTSREKECAPVRAYFRLSTDKRVLIFFVKRNLPNEIIFRHFGNGHFEMPFAYELPGFILKRLGLEHYKIHPGKYPVQEDCNFIKVYF